jgi:hypothetical protein
VQCRMEMQKTRISARPRPRIQPSAGHCRHPVKITAPPPQASIIPRVTPRSTPSMWRRAAMPFTRLSCRICVIEEQVSLSICSAPAPHPRQFSILALDELLPAAAHATRMAVLVRATENDPAVITPPTHPYPSSCYSCPLLSLTEYSIG